MDGSTRRGGTNSPPTHRPQGMELRARGVLSGQKPPRFGDCSGDEVVEPQLRSRCDPLDSGLDGQPGEEPRQILKRNRVDGAFSREGIDRALRERTETTLQGWATREGYDTHWNDP